jgi:hypothetical protein
MLSNSYGITEFIGNRGRLTEFVGNYMKVPELFCG